MRYCRFEDENGRARYGFLREQAGELWIDAPMGAPEEDLRARLEERDREAAAFRATPLREVRLLAPVTPGKIVCVGRNYREHAAELGNALPSEPMLFFKPPTAILAPEGVIKLPAWAGRVDYEGELAVVIGRHARHIGGDVGPYIRGYTLLNDVSARELQKRDGQWARAKGMDTFCPIGPWVSDELPAPGEISLVTRQNGVLRQDGNTRDLIFSIPELLRFISSAMTLEPGDVIATGTPKGVGPLGAGDSIEVEAAGLGVLRNRVQVLASAAPRV